MSKRTKSGQRQKKHKVKQRLKRRIKRQKAAAIAAGYVKKGPTPA